LAEWIQVNRAAAIEMDPSTILNYSVVTNYGSEADYKVTGSTASMPVINVSETKNKAIFTYRNKDNFDFVMGAQNSSATSSEGMRTVSFLVKQFSLFSLPVKLISFSASLTNSKTELNWKTTAELNLSHFAVEKSTDGINFSAIGTVIANGSQTTETSYHYSDMVNSQETIIYYRLRSVDFDGKGEYSEIRVIRTNKKEQGAISILAYPNPVSTELRVTIPESWQQKKLLYEIITLAGQTVMQKENTNSSQTETVSVNNLSAGIYLLRVTCKGQTAQQRIVKD
jgi:Secretion system C-terminal sorting domain